jgi:hypothetical protein
MQRSAAFNRAHTHRWRSQTHLKRVEFYMPVELKQMLQQKAYYNGLKQSEYLRWLIQKGR